MRGFSVCPSLSSVGTVSRASKRLSIFLLHCSSQLNMWLPPSWYSFQGCKLQPIWIFSFFVTLVCVLCNLGEFLLPSWHYLSSDHWLSLSLGHIKLMLKRTRIWSNITLVIHYGLLELFVSKPFLKWHRAIRMWFINVIVIKYSLIPETSSNLITLQFSVSLTLRLAGCQWFLNKIPRLF